MQQDPTDPTGVRDDTTRGNSEVARARLRKADAAVELRRQGASWDDVAEVLGYPTGRAALVATEKALEKELHTEGKDFLKRLTAERLDSLLKNIWEKANDPDSPEQLAAVREARGIISDVRKLHGLDAPTEVNVSSPSQPEIEAWVGKVLALQSPPLEEGDIFDVDFTEEESDAVSAG